MRINLPKVRPSSGTAFSVDRSGVWITARHVVDGCTRVGLQTGQRKGILVQRIISHPNADVSILWTRRGFDPLPLAEGDVRAGQDGFQFGFPKGQPGDVHVVLLGKRRLQISGRYSTSETVLAWVQRRRVPDHGPDLGGISGGPVLDSTGAVVGSVVGGAPRRGRSYTAAPASLLEALRVAKVKPRRGAGTAVSRNSFPEDGDRMRRDLTVAKVYCMIGDGGSRSRRRL